MPRVIAATTPFPLSASLLAPVWIAERAVCSWLAVGQRLRYGGVRYGDAVIPTAAHPLRTLRRRAARRARPGAPAATTPARPATARVTPYRDGPYLLRGPFELVDQDGNEIATHRATIALCRCGRSQTRPFCDGTHKLVGFRAASGAEGAPGG